MKWPRELWLEAIWNEPVLGPTERAVAYAYARYAGSTDTSWCTWEELMLRTGAKRTAVYTAVTKLRAQGWLFQVQPPHGQDAPVYRLTVQGFTIDELSTGSPARGSESEPLVGARGSRNRPEGFAKPARGVRNANPSSQRSFQESSDHPHARATAAATPVDGSAATPQTAAVAAAALRARTGVEVPASHARAVAAQLLTAASGPVRQPARYVRRAIERDEHPERFLPTPTPPRIGAAPSSRERTESE